MEAFYAIRCTSFNAFITDHMRHRARSNFMPIRGAIEIQLQLCRRIDVRPCWETGRGMVHGMCVCVCWRRACTAGYRNKIIKRSSADKTTSTQHVMLHHTISSDRNLLVEMISCLKRSKLHLEIVDAILSPFEVINHDAYIWLGCK